MNNLMNTFSKQVKEYNALTTSTFLINHVKDLIHSRSSVLAAFLRSFCILKYVYVTSDQINTHLAVILMYLKRIQMDMHIYLLC